MCSVSHNSLIKWASTILILSTGNFQVLCSQTEEPKQHQQSLTVMQGEGAGWLQGEEVDRAEGKETI